MSALAVPTHVSPMSMLESGVPLSLLLDLVLGPRSEDLISEERRALRTLPTDAG